MADRTQGFGGMVVAQSVGLSVEVDDNRAVLEGVAVGAGGVQSQIQGAFAFGQALAGGSLECFDLGVVVGRPQMLNLARTTPRRAADLHRGRPRGVFTVRT